MLAGMEMPVLNYQAQFLMGKLQLANGKTAEAYESYQRARTALENLRSTLHGEELKIGFMKNKFQVYEELVELCLARGNSGCVTPAASKQGPSSTISGNTSVGFSNA